MTADLQSLAARVRAIEQTIPLLEAIRSEAEIAYRRAERTSGPVQEYARRVEVLIADVAAAMDGEQRALLLADPVEAGPTALLVVSSERGLCGAFNRLLASKALELVHQGSTAGKATRVLCWGSRAKRLIEAAGQEVLYGASLASVALPTYETVEAMALEILALQDRYRFGRLLVLHNKPAARFQYEATVRQLLPPRLGPLPRRRPRIELKPAGDVPAMAAHVLTEWLLMDLYRAALESALSEQLARIATMRLAVENARKLLGGLRFEYSRARQHAVTDALLEVISGYRTATER